MNQITKTAVTFGILILLLFGLYLFANWFSKTTGYVLGEDEKINLAQCLAGKKSVFYISSTCPSCDLEKELFGETALKFLEIKECRAIEECPEGGVPAWEINGEIYYGFKKLSELIQISKCNVE
ncbi:MAG: hypothetical protein Q8P57_01340 [Candidatus Pacearchaeota archaeon]|nr:hypothetical protein [Candidatus Pacearchaeota archaeon]